MPMDVSPTGSGSRENAFTASYRAEWAHFQAAIAGEAKVASLAGASHAAQGDGRDLPLGPGRPRRGAVRRRGGTRCLLLARWLGAGARGRRRPVAPPEPRAPSSPST